MRVAAAVKHVCGHEKKSDENVNMRKKKLPEDETPMSTTCDSHVNGSFCLSGRAFVL